MFYAIHRTIKLFLLCGWLWVGYKIYTHRDIFEPVIIWYDVWDNGGFDAPALENIDGKVVHIVNGQTFIMQPAKGSRINVRLMCLRDPAADLSIEAREKEKRRKDALEELILNKDVKVKLLYQNLNNIGGLVFLDDTNNINANLVFRGYAVSSKDKLKGASKEDQYTMLWAIRHRTRIF